MNMPEFYRNHISSKKTVCWTHRNPLVLCPFSRKRPLALLLPKVDLSGQQPLCHNRSEGLDSALNGKMYVVQHWSFWVHILTPLIYPPSRRCRTRCSLGDICVHMSGLMPASGRLRFLFLSSLRLQTALNLKILQIIICEHWLRAVLITEATHFPSFSSRPTTSLKPCPHNGLAPINLAKPYVIPNFQHALQK